MKVMSLFLPEIQELLAARDFRSIRRLLGDINPVDLADGWASFSPQQQAALFRVLPRRRAAQVFEELEPEEQKALLAHVREVDIRELVTDLDPAETTRLSRELPPALTRKLFAFMKKDSARQVATLLSFPPKSVGSLMRTRFVRLKPHWSARQALEHVQITTRLRQIDQTYLENLYVTDENDRWLGHVPLRVLIVAPRDLTVAELLRRSPRWFAPEQDQEEAGNVFRKYRLNSAPVLDAQQKLMGILLVRDVLEVIEEEAEEDIQKLGGMEALREPYFQVSFFGMVRKRASWLVVLFISEMLTATAMAYFEAEIARAVVLALFIPLIISSGGNSGSQAATLVVRALALGEVGFADWWRVVRREFASGLFLGAILGALGFLRVSLWSQFTPLYGPHYLLVAATVGLALVLIVLWGTLAGSILPILLKRAGLDPAVASAPFVATLVDVTGIVIYFTVAMLVLQGTLL